jgi:mRNA interferase HigB
MLAYCHQTSNFTFVNVIKRQTLITFCKKHGDSLEPMKTWFSICRKANWETYHDLQQDYPEAFPIGDNRVVFDLKGNRYRIIARILFTYKQVQIKWIGTHAAYDKIDALTVRQ